MATPGPAVGLAADPIVLWLVQLALAVQVPEQVTGVRLEHSPQRPAQTPLAVQVFPAPQAAQAAPLAPHAPCRDPARQTVPSQHPAQLDLLHFALLLDAHRLSTQANPLQQLKFSSQRVPSGLHPPSHRPLTQRPEQQWASLPQLM
jgi:hypothetical protein